MTGDTEDIQTGAPTQPPPGIDPEGLEAWFAEHVSSVRPPLRFQRIAGGRSNLTFSVEDSGGGRWALRRPPLGETLGSAHDMGREHRVVTALEPTAVPVPRVVGRCDEAEVTGAPFYVMEWVNGPVLRDGEEAAEHFPDPGGRRAIGERVVDTLVEIHSVDPDGVGLGELGRKEAYVERQLRRWQGQWEKSKVRELPVVERVTAELGRRVPEQGPATIVHGDYRLDNLILSPAGEVAAVVDWELCTLGDPLADVGLLLVYWVEPGDDLIPLLQPATQLEGFPSRAEVRERYAERSGRDLAEIDFYVALGYWKLAIILEGVLARTAAGQYGEPDPDAVQGMKDVVAQLANAAEQNLA